MTSRKAMVIDDEPLMAEFIADVLDEVGFSCEVACDARQALQTLFKLRPELLVLDLVMPGMDGIEVIRHIADAGLRDVQLVLVSGHDVAVLRSAEQVARERSLRVVGVLQKPLRLSQLVEKFENVELASAQPADQISDEQLAAQLPEVIARQQIEVHYQPQVALDSGEVVGVEALARWQHPTYGFVPPARFIPFAEQHGLVKALTDTVLRRTFDDLNQWRREGYRFSASVNISGAYVDDLGLPERLEKQLWEVGLQPSDVRMELTETAVMEDLANSMDILTRLRLRGFALSIDDFGTGYSTFIQLHRIPFTEIKIDRSFVHLINEENDARAIVESTIMLADRLGMVSVAEGIEHSTQFSAMRTLGCERAQGYHIARPMAARDISPWIQQWSSA
ncbi:MAG: EAL domain-containing response regulator [Pseudomonadota bacterium]